MEPLPTPNKAYSMIMRVEKQNDVYMNVTDPNTTMSVRDFFGVTIQPKDQTNIIKNTAVIVKWPATPRKPVLNCMFILFGTRN